MAPPGAAPSTRKNGCGREGENSVGVGSRRKRNGGVDAGDAQKERGGGNNASKRAKEGGPVAAGREKRIRGGTGIDFVMCCWSGILDAKALERREGRG